jgi:hypothetical protein
LQELKNAKGTDRQQWLKRLEELDQVLIKMQTQVPVSAEKETTEVTKTPIPSKPQKKEPAPVK